MWLVETTIDGRPHWVRCKFFELRATEIEWADDANNATKFPRTDAEDLAKKIGAIATEHVWMGPVHEPGAINNAPVAQLDRAPDAMARAVVGSSPTGGEPDELIAYLEEIEPKMRAQAKGLWAEGVRMAIARLRTGHEPRALQAGDRIEWRGHQGTVTATGVVRVTLDSGNHHTLPIDQLTPTKGAAT